MRGEIEKGDWQRLKEKKHLLVYRRMQAAIKRWTTRKVKERQALVEARHRSMRMMRDLSKSGRLR